MKKTYEKPQIYMERFELAEHIASGCGFLATYRDGVGCFEGGPLNGMFYGEMHCGEELDPSMGENYGYWAEVGNSLFTS